MCKRGIKAAATLIKWDKNFLKSELNSLTPQKKVFLQL